MRKSFPIFLLLPNFIFFKFIIKIINYKILSKTPNSPNSSKTAISSPPTNKPSSSKISNLKKILLDTYSSPSKPSPKMPNPISSSSPPLFGKSILSKQKNPAKSNPSSQPSKVLLEPKFLSSSNYVSVCVGEKRKKTKFQCILRF